MLESLESPDIDPGLVHSALQETEFADEIPQPEITDEGISLGVEELIDPETGKSLSELDQLKAHLDWLISQEDYEQAAKIRDKIIKLEGGG
ncbi:MAG: UvrB/UvrC motif-containing protein [Candidatus Latescibacterota bacterium]